MVARFALALVGFAAALASHTAVAAGRSCEVDAAFEPDVAYVGQQVLWRVWISRAPGVVDVDWEEAPRFPGLRAEWLPGHAEESTSSAELPYQREEHRALFAARAGVFHSGAATLRCEDEQGTSTSERVVLAPRELTILALPEQGRPEDFDGLVGRFALQAHADRKQITLGESVRLSIVMRGTTNLWDARTPQRELSTSTKLEVFPDRPSLDLQAGDRLYVRRAFAFDLVPRETGTLVIPETRVAYFDPDSGRYAEVTAAAIQIDVAPRIAAAVEPGTPPEPGGDEAPPSWPWFAAALALAAGSALGVPALRRRSRERRELAQIEADLVRAADLLARRQPRRAAAAWSDALRRAIARRDPSLAGVEGSDLRARASNEPDLLAAAELLATLDRLRFDRSERTCDEAQVRRVIDRLGRHRPDVG